MSVDSCIYAVREGAHVVEDHQQNQNMVHRHPRVLEKVPLMVLEMLQMELDEGAFFFWM